MLAVDTTVTSRTRANTGVQRVTREFTKCLSNICDVQPLCYNQGIQRWQVPAKGSLVRIFHQEDLSPSRRRGSRSRPWTVLQKLLEPRNYSRTIPPFPLAGFIEPEIFTPQIHKALQGFLQYVNGPSLALYYDATPLKLPELSPRGNTGRFPAYLRQLLHFNGIAAISETSKQELLGFWKWMGINEHPPVEAIPLAVDLAHHRTLSTKPEKRMPTVLCVGTIEGRKNQISPLQAADSLWEKGQRFKLTLLGLASRSTSNPATTFLDKLLAKGRPVEWLGPRSENDLRTQYATCHFTVYPSLAEGFGLPVLESLKHGKPCICSSQGAIGEVSTKGGCLTVDHPSPTQLAAAIEKLLTDSKLHEQLRTEARERHFRTWSDYASDILQFHKSLAG